VDLWTPAEGDTRLLDMDEIEKARAGRWPPAQVRAWPLDAVPALRLRRDEPGTYYANLVSSRIIAYGIYCLGAVALTSVAFAAFSDAFVGGRPARTAWLVSLAAEALALLPVALSGKLPAARRVRMGEVLTEHTLFLAAAVCAAAILLVHDSSLWRSLLSAVYGALGLFLGVFATCRAAFDRAWPGLALAGLGVCVIALIVLM
jgi:hypothetical protein